VGVSQLYSNVFGLPARHAALLGTSALVIGSALAVGPAHATSSGDGSGAAGKATAVAARADLDVSVADGGNVSVETALNEVSAPGEAEETLLTAKVNGAHGDRAVTLVKAKVAHAAAKADARRSVGRTKLVGVRAYAPGLPTNPLLSADLLKAGASCVAGEKPVAKAALADRVTVLGQPVTINAPGSQQVEVPGVGTVKLELEHRTTTDSTAAATALRLKYSVNPGSLGVVKTTGEIVLAEATCTTPDGSGGTDGGSGDGGSDSEGSSSGSSGSGGSGSGGSDGSDNGGSGDSGSGGGDSGNGGNSGGDSGGTATEGNGGSGGTATEGSATDGQSDGTAAGSDSDAEGADSDDNEPTTQSGSDGENLAETGGSSATPLIAGVGAALVLGGAATYLIRRRAAQNG
jgi:LPXTG-motif cell wall-anchored protein